MSFFLHVKKYFFIEFLQAYSEFFILLPNLSFIQFIIVGNFGHVFISLRVADRWSGNVGKGRLGGISVSDCPCRFHFNYIIEYFYL